jgi:hypothetical protein
MNGDALELSTLIGKNHADLKEDIGKLATAFAEHKGNINARVSAVEESQRKADTRQWYHTAIIIPVLSVLHGVANHFKWNI